MSIKRAFIILCVVSAANANADQTGPFTSTIKQLQVKDIGNPYNTVFLDIDITNSPCSSTNQSDRFTVLNSAQQGTVLAAVMSKREVTIYGKGTCNTGNIEDISAIIIKP